jgi:hypothetical protein
METPEAVITEAAPAPAETISASVDASNKGDFTAFQESERAKRQGTPQPDVPAPSPVAPPPRAVAAPVTPVAAATAAPVTLSKRQQDANERTRAAVERATSDLQAENARLRAAAQHTPPPVREPEWKRVAAMPNSPKLADFETVEEHAAAMSGFVQDQRAESAQRDQHETQRQRFLMERGDKFTSKLQEAAAADPAFIDRIHPELQNARPLSGCVRTEKGLIDPGTGKPASFSNVAAEAGLLSDHPGRLYSYFDAHNDEVEAIVALPSSEWLTSLIRLDGRLSGAPAAPAAPAPAATASPVSVLSAAPPPPPTIQGTGSTGDPQQAALAKNDFAALQQLWRAERVARRSA